MEKNKDVGYMYIVKVQMDKDKWQLRGLFPNLIDCIAFENYLSDTGYTVTKDRYKVPVTIDETD